MSEALKSRILKEANLLRDELVAVRRHIHQHPELSFEEVQTSAFLKDKLSEAGISFSDGWVKTGILAVISGTSQGKTVALRGDMDALPIQEESQEPYASRVPSVMHACGHDVHSTCLLGAGMILQKISSELKGNVQLVFQPGEEKLPGGAKLMMEAGIFQNQQPDAMFALHVFPQMQVGHLGFRSGMYMASTDELYFTVRGKGGHAAMPHQVKDPVLAASAFVVALQQVTSRLAPPTIPTVLSVGKINSTGGATNVIPDEVKLEGTFRTMDETWRAQAHQHISRIAAEVGNSYGVSIEVDIRKGYPVLSNHPVLTENARLAAISLLGDDKIHPLEMRMTAEDFAWFAQEYSACFFRLGTHSPEGKHTAGVHTSTFDIDEEALVVGAATMAWLAASFLNSEV
jgi:amidohydrolase